MSTQTQNTRPSLRARLMLSMLLAAGFAQDPLQAQEPMGDGSSLTTSDRVQQPGWWPTKGDAARSAYVGSETCAGCHASIAAQQQTRPMFHASVRAAQSEVLQHYPQLFFQEEGQTGSLSYSLGHIATGSREVTFRVNDGNRKDAAEIVWGFGAGSIGQTFVLKKGDTYLESRLSYFTSLGALDITIGHSPQPPADVEGAFGHAMDTASARRCFSCHTTEAVASSSFEPAKALPGVQCEACHGPGAAHLAAVKSRDFKQASATVMNPARLAPVDSVDYCGACHRTWADVVMQSPAGIERNTVRFQPYLLENSRCWGTDGDARLTCIACHDPHKPLVKESSAYDSKCLACHAAKLRKMCKVGTSQCTTCHMPKYELPQSHAAFTDHLIRVLGSTNKK